MNKRLSFLMLAAASSLALADVSVVDDTGATVRLSRPARRIVTLAPHLAETLFAAGAGERLAGAVDYSDYPEAARSVPRVGGYSRVDLEAVVAERTEMTRFGVSKHLRLLEQAGLVVTEKRGREKLHYLNPVPIRLIHDRWIDKFTETHVVALTDLKRQLEESP